MPAVFQRALYRSMKFGGNFQPQTWFAAFIPTCSLQSVSFRLGPDN